MTLTIRLAALVSIGCYPAVALAQPGGAPQDIVVTGRGLGGTPGERAFDVVTVDRAAIRANAAQRLESVLADVAGVQQFRRSDSRSANPTSQGVSLRGIGGNASGRALLLLDGVPQADPFGGWVAFPAYATGRLGLIRVTRGGGSGFAGPGALAGTIELESATPDQLAPVEGSVAYGSRDSIDAQAAATLVRGPGFATLSGAYARGDGFIPTVRADRGPIDRAAPYEQASAALRGVIDLGARTEAQANLSAFTDRRERGTPFTANRSEGADASLRIVGRGRWGWSALAYLQARAFASGFAAIDSARTAATRTLNQYDTPATGIGARIELAPPLRRGIAVRVGADARRVTGRTQELYTYVAGAPTRSRMAGGASSTIGAFADGSVAAGAFTLSLGGRIDRWRIMDGRLLERPLAEGAALTDSRFPDRAGTEATGRGGIAWAVARPLTLRAAAYRGWRLPTLNELYRPFRVGADATAANAALSPERLSGYEGGATLTPTATTRIAATVFRNVLTDAIANVTAGRGAGTFPGVGFVAAGGVYRVRRNVDSIRATGMELDASWRGERFGARASWSHTSSRVRASGAAVALDGLRPAQTPRDLVSATIDWHRDRAAAALTVRHAARQYEDDQNSRRLRSATTLDGTIALPLGPAFAIEMRGENVLNARVEAGISGADVVERATPRTLWLGIRYRAR